MITVRSFNEIIGGRDAEFSADKFARTYTRQFQLVVAQPDANPAEIQAYNRLPALYAPYSCGGIVDVLALCKRKRPKQLKIDPRAWEITCEWSTLDINPDQNQNNDQPIENPLDRPPVVGWDTEIYQRPLEKDIDDNPIANTAGQPFDPAIEVDDARLVMTVQRNELTFDKRTMAKYLNKLNADPFVGFDKRLAKFHKFSATTQFENGLRFWSVNYIIHFRDEDWDREIIDAGFYEKIDGQLAIIKDRAGFPVSEAAFLNGHGRHVPSLPAHFLTFKVYKDIKFKPLKLPET